MEGIFPIIDIVASKVGDLPLCERPACPVELYDDGEKDNIDNGQQHWDPDGIEGLLIRRHLNSPSYLLHVSFFANCPPRYLEPIVQSQRQLPRNGLAVLVSRVFG